MNEQHTELIKSWVEESIALFPNYKHILPKNIFLGKNSHWLKDNAYKFEHPKWPFDIKVSCILLKMLVHDIDENSVQYQIGYECGELKTLHMQYQDIRLKLTGLYPCFDQVVIYRNYSSQGQIGWHEMFTLDVSVPLAIGYAVWERARQYTQPNVDNWTTLVCLDNILNRL